jgi:hypothetical protein
MSLQKLFQDKKALEVFEKAALSEGFTVFTKRGQFYCLSDLNVFARGWLAAMKNVVIIGDGLPSEPLQDFYQVEVKSEAEMYAKSETKAA